MPPDHNPDMAFEASSVPSVEPRPITGIDPARIPPRSWVFGRRFIRKSVTATVAPPGTSKTMLALHEAVAVATGTEWAGQIVHEPGPVWLYNNEEDIDELHRRLFAVLDHMDVDYSAVEGRLFINSGADYPLLVATKDENGSVIQTPDVTTCIEHIRRLDIRLFIADPFIEMHEVDENSNPQIKAAAAMFREIAQQADCAVELNHHTRKPLAGSSEGHAGNMDTARGAGALVGVARIVHTLFGMSEKEGERLGVPDDERHLHVRLDVAKSNYALVSASPLWFRRDSVTIANGDEVGVLTSVDLSDLDDLARHKQHERHRTIIARLLTITTDTISLNRAGLMLIDQRETLFPNYRGKDFDGKCPAPIRNEIETAVKSGITIDGEGFTLTCNTPSERGKNRRAKVLQRMSAEDD